MICQDTECTAHYGCRLRKKSIGVSPKATPNRARNWRPTPDKPPSHYAEKAYDVRPDGSKMPILNPDGSPVRHRQAQREHHRIDDHLRATRSLTAQE